MLLGFSVENFKCFQDKISFDLDDVNGYEFNKNLINDGVLKTGVIFGKNGSGKTNLCLAFMDIVNHLTDKQSTSNEAFPYVNLDSPEDVVKFEYRFRFNGLLLEYKYSKKDPETLISEDLMIGDIVSLHYSYLTSSGFSKLKGTENLKINNLNPKISFVKYINNNSILENTPENNVFKEFMLFVDNMLAFSSIDRNTYFGFRNGSDYVADAIVKKGKLKGFEQFLNELDIPCKLEERESNGLYSIVNKYENGDADFYKVASTGTKSLAVFYYWLISAANASFIIMDEFDAFYHYELSEVIVKTILRETKNQVIFTSHNTNLMSSQLFRPDCLFILSKNSIKSFSKLTDKELRLAHNLQKMYKAGAFDEL